MANLPPTLPDAPLNILLVDDDEADVLLTRKAIQKSGLDIHLDAVEDGVEALLYLRRRPPYANAIRPDLVLLDLNMPRKDGKTTLTEVKADPELRSIPVAVLTTSLEDQEIIKSFGMQASYYVTKPVDKQQFETLLHSLSATNDGVTS